MVVSSIEIRACQNTREVPSGYGMRAGGTSTFDFLVITMRTNEGMQGHSFGFAGRGAEMAGYVAQSAVKPFFLGKGSARARKTLAGVPHARSMVEPRPDLCVQSL